MLYEQCKFIQTNVIANIGKIENTKTANIVFGIQEKDGKETYTSACDIEIQGQERTHVYKLSIVSTTDTRTHVLVERTPTGGPILDMSLQNTNPWVTKDVAVQAIQAAIARDTRPNID